jgi:hypothetical protein
MKLVINGEYGGYGFGVAEEFEDLVDECSRDDEKLVAFVEEHPDKCGDLRVVEIPDEATDWEIDAHDGLELVIYVVGGKIYHLH